jgi:hypothetical protein
MPLEGLISELVQRTADSSSTEEVEEHEEPVGCLACLESFLQSIVRNLRRLKVTVYKKLSQQDYLIMFDFLREAAWRFQPEELG